QSFSWVEKGPKTFPNLQNTLYINFFKNGNIRKFELVRDEPTHDGIAPGIRYSWEWNKDMLLIDYPEKWDTTFPWTKFSEIHLPPKMYQSLIRHQ
ncbi:MAG TPA: hypothetical protein VFQ58_03135, partial [Flavisolibacter sp.]|nr:hypothetical protein [Flavisolibacter sp.]